MTVSVKWIGLILGHVAERVIDVTVACFICTDIQNQIPDRG